MNGELVIGDRRREGTGACLAALWSPGGAQRGAGGARASVRWPGERWPEGAHGVRAATRAASLEELGARIPVIVELLLDHGLLRLV
jgi:hypothetical protein